MANPSRITDFSVTASNNVPDGTDTIGSNADDLIRAIQATIRGDLAHKGSDIASATTTDLGAVQGLFHDITGTTTITGFGTVAAGVWKVLKFEGALTLTHNATSLILPGGANITTADGHIAIVVSEGSGNWRCVAYSGRASNAVTLAGTDSTQIVTPSGLASVLGMVKLNSGTVSAAATLDIALTSYTQSKFRLVLENFLPATDNVSMLLRFSTDGGSNFDAGASDYGSIRYIRTTADTDGSVGEATSAIIPANAIGNVSTEGVSGVFDFLNLTSATRYSSVVYSCVSVTNGGAIQFSTGGGARGTAQNTDALRVLFSSGNITSGTWVLYGYN